MLRSTLKCSITGLNSSFKERDLLAAQCAVGLIIQKTISACEIRLITVSLKLIEHLSWFPIEPAGPYKLIMPTFTRRERRLMVLFPKKFGHSACLQDVLVHLPSWITTYLTLATRLIRVIMQILVARVSPS